MARIETGRGRTATRSREAPSRYRGLDPMPPPRPKRPPGLENCLLRLTPPEFPSELLPVASSGSASSSLYSWGPPVPRMPQVPRTKLSSINHISNPSLMELDARPLPQVPVVPLFGTAVSGPSRYEASPRAVPSVPAKSVLRNTRISMASSVQNSPSLSLDLTHDAWSKTDTLDVESLASGEATLYPLFCQLDLVGDHVDEFEEVQSAFAPSLLVADSSSRFGSRSGSSSDFAESAAGASLKRKETETDAFESQASAKRRRITVLGSAFKGLRSMGSRFRLPRLSRGASNEASQVQLQTTQNLFWLPARSTAPARAPVATVIGQDGV